MWEKGARPLLIRNKPSIVVVSTLTKNEIVRRLPWIVGGIIFAFPGTIAAGYAVSFVAESYMQAFYLGFVPSTIGLGILGAQIILIHEGIHHTFFKTNNWMPKMRRVLPILAITISSYFPLLFLPVQNPILIWQHPLVEVIDVILISLLGISSPYLAKVGYDYFPITFSEEQKIWEVSIILISVYYAIATLILFFLSPRLSKLDILTHTTILVISLIGVLYAVKWNFDVQRNSEPKSEVPNAKDGNRLQRIRDSKLLTFIAAALVGAWLPIVAGASAAVNAGLSPSPLGVEPGIFIYGYPNLFFMLWLLIFGPLIIVAGLSLLVGGAIVLAEELPS